MAKLLLLDTEAMQNDFFEDTAMIGIRSAQPGYRFCWLLNKHFDIDFKNYPEQNLSLVKNGATVYFPTYQHDIDNSNYKYLLYKLKSGTENLIPEVKHLDYLWLIQTIDPEHDAHTILHELRNLPQVEMSQLLAEEQIKKSLNSLIM